jgi:hypothetical protein
MTANEVSMEVSLENVPDGNPIRLGSLQINLYITLRIDDNGLAIRRQQVRGVRQTT